MTTELPYETLPPTPETYSAGTVLARYVDGLGFRFYWATDGLTDTDLAHRAAPGARTLAETLGHIHHLVRAVACTVAGQAYDRRPDADVPAWDRLRRDTLETLCDISRQIGTWSPADFEAHHLRIVADGAEHTLPFWNVINGMLSDALYHVGQIVASRRASGNPIDPGVRVLTGVRLSDAGR